MPVTAERVDSLKAAAHEEHRGVFITGPQRIELLRDSLPESVWSGEHVITASLANCRCASDGKAIKQFHGHARVPNDATQVALGHETVQVVVLAPEGSGVQAGDIVFITPGHSSIPIDPQTFTPQDDGVLTSLGYSYRYLGGLRAYSAVPIAAIDFVRSQGFGSLFTRIDDYRSVSIGSLAHAEPFACNYGTNTFMFEIDENGAFRYGIPPKANIAYLAGTARMAMINLTIVADVPVDHLPSVVSITGSPKKLAALEEFALIKRLRTQGVTVELIDRNDPQVIDRLTAHGRPQMVWTNFASQEIYDQATAIVAPGGNINNYAGAADPDLVLRMPISTAAAQESIAEKIGRMHHNVGPQNPERHWGLARDGRVALVGFVGREDAIEAWRSALGDAEVVVIDDAAAYDGPALNDVFIAGSGEAAATAYSAIEPHLARCAAVQCVDGDCVLAVRSRLSHYTTRHQICGSNVPWFMTNTSEPHADNMAIQARKQTDFDWMVVAVVGLDHVLLMMDDVEQRNPFGTFLTLMQLETLPYVEVSAQAFRDGAERCEDERAAEALRRGAAVLDENGDVWSRAVEEAMYAGYGLPYPLAS